MRPSGANTHARIHAVAGQHVQLAPNNARPRGDRLSYQARAIGVLQLRQNDSVILVAKRVHLDARASSKRAAPLQRGMSREMAPQTRPQRSSCRQVFSNGCERGMQVDDAPLDLVAFGKSPADRWRQVAYLPGKSRLQRHTSHTVHQATYKVAGPLGRSPATIDTDASSLFGFKAFVTLRSPGSVS